MVLRFPGWAALSALLCLSGAARGLEPSLVVASRDAPFMPAERQVQSRYFWWPTVVLERGSTHLTGARSRDETRLGLALAFRGFILSPHVRVLVSPSFGEPYNVSAMAGGGLRAMLEVAGIPLSYGVGLHVETRLRDSLWLAYATPLELGTALYRGESAEHFVFVGARRTLAGSLINSYLLDPNGYDNEAYAERLADMRGDHAWQLYVSFCFGRRIE
jgi:hypothetical protein